MYCCHFVYRGLFAATLLVGATAILGAQSPDLTTASAVNNRPIVSPSSIATLWGANLTAQTQAAGGLPLSTTLGGVQIGVTGADNLQAGADLYLASPGQINFVVPSQTSLGKGGVTLTANGVNRIGEILVSNVAPSLITVNSMGSGIAVGQVIRVGGAGGPITDQTVNDVVVGAQNTAAYLVLYGTGIRGRSANPVQALLNGVKVPVLYAGMQSQFPGLDQVNLGPLPASLAGSGTVNLELFVDGVPANVVNVRFR